MKTVSSNNNYYTISLTLLVSLFVCFKLSVLNVPLFWDELGVYGKGIFELIENGISMHPNALEPEISRGHPLLFSNLIAILSKIFGDGIHSLRLASLLISCFTLFSFFYIISKHSTKQVAFIASFILSSQAIFFAQSTMILPEILLGVLWFWTLHFYLNKQFALYFLFGACMILTKETSTILIGALMLYDCFKNISNKQQFITSSLVLFSPVIPFLIFLIVQKTTYGWYLFPYHSNGFNFSVDQIWNNLQSYLIFISIEQGRIFGLPLIIAGVGFYLYKKQHNELMVASIVCSLIYLLFGSTTFYLNRYMIVIVMALVFITSHSLVYSCTYIFKNNYRILSTAILSLTLFIASLSSTLKSHNKYDSFNYDEDMSYLIQVNSLEKTVSYLESHSMHLDSLVVFFPVDFALADMRYGYKKNNLTYRITNKIDDGTSHMIIYDPPGFKPKVKKYNLTILEEMKHQFCSTTVYKIDK